MQTPQANTWVWAMATTPHRVNNVVNLDGYYRKACLLEWIGAIATRKFTMDLHLVKSIRHVLKKGDVLGMYPEARYSPAVSRHICRIPWVR